MSWPRPKEILELYSRHVEALRWTGVGGVRSDSRSLFFNWSQDDLDGTLKAMRRELDHTTVLVLCASLEAILRTDFDERITRKPKGGMTKRFRKLHDEFSDRVRFDDIIDAWKAEINAKEKLGRLNRLFKHRHWLAHGRRFVDKSGLGSSVLDPNQAWTNIAEPCLDAMRNADPSFPLG